MLAISSPLQQFFDLDGDPLDDGRLFFGVANQNPETSPITVFWDAAGTQPAAQPIRTLNGYPSRNGAIGTVYAAGDYSLTVRTRKGQLVRYVATAADTNNDLALQAEIDALSADLASTATGKGAALVGFKQGGSGAQPRTLEAKAREVQVSPEDFAGCDPTGVTSSVSSINAAGAYLASLGGGAIVGTGKYLIDANVTLPDGVSLIGPWQQPDELLPGAAADYDALRGQLIISSSATLTTGDSSAVVGWLILRQGLNLPFADATAATAGVAAFAGTALTVGGAGSTFRHLLILGFNKAIYSSNFERVRIAYVSGDCINGIEIFTCFDISYVNFCHFWPWTTVHQAWTTNALLRRSGHAYLLANVGDWNMVSHCFSYGYFRGGRTASCDNVTWVNCGADNTSTAGVGDHAGSVGFTAEGTSLSTRWIGGQAAAQSDGYLVNVSAGAHVEMSSCQSWGCSARGVMVDGGDLTIQGGELRDVPLGVLLNNTASRVFIDNVRFRNHSTGPVGFNVSNANTYLGQNNDYSDTAAGSTPIVSPANWPVISIASAAAISLPANGFDFLITGTTTFGTLNGGWKGRVVTLYFQSALTVNHSTGATSSMRLSGGANFAVTATGTLTLRHNGTQWFEIGRCA
jgi:hypothetical protein